MSTKPGVTRRPAASSSSRPRPGTAPTAAITPASTATSAGTGSPPRPSATSPPRTTRSYAVVAITAPHPPPVSRGDSEINLTDVPDPGRARERSLSSAICQREISSQIAAPCDTRVLPSDHGVGELRRGPRDTGGVGRGELRRRAPPSWSSTGSSHASSPSSPRPRRPSRLGGSGRPMGPRRPALDRHAVSGPPGRGPAPGAPGAEPAPPAPRGRGLAPRAIGTDQARAIASARRHRTEASMARDEEMLVSQAAQMGFEDFYRALSYWKQLADPDGADAAEEEPQEPPQRLFGGEPRRHVAGPDDPRPRLGRHCLGRAQPPRARPLRGRLRRGQAAPGAHGADRRAGPHLGPAPGRRPRGDGRPQRQRPRRGDPPRPALLGLRRLRDDVRSHL